MAKVKKTKKIIKEASVSSKTEGVTNFDFKTIEPQLEALITKNLPALPKNIIDVLVNIAPWLAVLGTIMGVPAIMALLGLNQFARYYNVPGMGFGWGYQVSNLLLIAQMVLTGLSIQGLFARKLAAWRLMYYAVWVSMLSSLLASGIVSMLLGGFIGFYLLFQTKKSYK